MYRVVVDKNRPDFRTFIDLLFGAERNVDTEGDSNPVSSRTWKYLYIKDREADVLAVEISAVQEEPGMFQVKSQSQRLEELAALYLFLYCGTELLFSSSSIDQEGIQSLKVKYNVELERAAAAIWHQSSEDNKYPNIA